MYSSKKDLIEKLESEKKRFRDNLSQIYDYDKDLYNRVDDYLFELISFINKELDEEVLSNDVTVRYKTLRDNLLESIYNCYGGDIRSYDSLFPQEVLRRQGKPHYTDKTAQNRHSFLRI